MLRNQPMMPGQMNPLNMRGRNGMVPPNLQKTVLQNNTNGLYAFTLVRITVGVIYMLTPCLAIDHNSS